MNELEFDRLIELYQMGLLKGREKKLVEDWLNKPEEEIHFSEVDKSRLKQAIQARINQYPTTMLVTHKSTVAKRFSIVYKVAAAILFMAVCSYFVWQLSNGSNEAVLLSAASSNGVNKVILEDGTLVWLKGDSKLIYPSRFSGNTRKVSLQGEALFEVAKDPKHPFIISCGELTTTVLGTSFNIKSSDKKIEVVVLSGKVSLTSASDSKGIIVLPNEKVVYDGSKMGLAPKQKTLTDEKSIAVKGTEYIMDFEDSRMKEVIRRIEQKFDVTISVQDEKLNNCMITADFSDQSLESTLSMISQVLGFEYDINGRSVALAGKGCD
jgi:ferric-dicitrate binding protein FerR (iron transport regulator)